MLYLNFKYIFYFKLWIINYNFLTIFGCLANSKKQKANVFEVVS